MINIVTMKCHSENMVHINISLPAFHSFFANGRGLCFIYESECSYTSHSTDALHAAQDSKVTLQCSTVCKLYSTWSHTRLSYFIQTPCYPSDWENIYIHEVSLSYLLPTLSAVSSDISECPKAVLVYGYDTTDKLIECSFINLIIY